MIYSWISCNKTVSASDSLRRGGKGKVGEASGGGGKAKRDGFGGVDSSSREKTNFRNRRPRESCGAFCHRFLSISKFVFVCGASLFQALGPWMLSTLEVSIVLLLYWLGNSHNLAPRLLTHRFSYVHSLEDIVGLSCTRSAILSLAYAFGGQFMHRPYLYCSYLLAASCFPYIVVKTTLYHYDHKAASAAIMLALTGAFCWFHVFASRRKVEWARRRYQMGLVGFGYPWTEGEEACVLLRRPDVEEMTKLSDAGSADDSAEDLTPEILADLDSKFIDIDGLKVHYKDVGPSGSTADSVSLMPDSFGIVLVHSFGGGVFSWRHIMEPLANECGCRVIAFDRPGFGLTSRPTVTNGDNISNPYSVASQAQLLLKLAAALGLEKVVLVSHADGCLLTMRAVSHAASAAAWYPTDTSDLLRQGRSQQLHQMGLPPIEDAFSDSTALYPPIPQYQQQQQYQHQQQMQDMARLSPEDSDNEISGVVESSGRHATANIYVNDHDPGLTSPLLAHQHQQSCSSPTDSRRVGGGSAGALDNNSRRAGVASTSGGALDNSSHLNRSHGEGERGGVCAEKAHCSTSTATQANDFVIESGSDAEAEVLRQRFRGLQQRLCCFENYPPEHFAHASSSSASQLGLDADLAKMNVKGVSSSSRLAGQAGNGASKKMAVLRPSSTASPPPCPSGHPQPLPRVLGVTLLHPNLSGQMGPTIFRLLARSKLGRSILRPMKWTEVGEVTNKRAWFNPAKMTSEVMELYRMPLRIEGSDAALIETSRLKREDAQGDLLTYFNDARSLTALIVTGEHDRIVPPLKAEALCWDLPRSRMCILPNCGHLSHEEAPELLINSLHPFCTDTLTKAMQNAAAAPPTTYKPRLH
eukprot:gene9-12818_t